VNATRYRKYNRAPDDGQKHRPKHVELTRTNHLTCIVASCTVGIWKKILNKIFGTDNESGIWHIKTNQELDEIIKRKNIINFIRAQRLSWLGHIERMQGTRTVKAIYCWKPMSRRPIGRPKTHWVDDVRKDIQKLKVPN
jgi:hypothetical protein